jgi:hypothetical protein
MNISNTTDVLNLIADALTCFRKNCKKQMELVSNIEYNIYINKRILLNKLKNSSITINTYDTNIHKLYNKLHNSKLYINEYECEMNSCNSEYKKFIDYTLVHILHKPTLVKQKYNKNDIKQIAKLTTDLLINSEKLLIDRNIDLAIELNEKQIIYTKNQL